MGTNVESPNLVGSAVSEAEAVTTTPSKITSSPRPSILRKRDNDG